MKCTRLLLLLVISFVLHRTAQAKQTLTHVSVCTVQINPKSLLGKKIEFSGPIVIGPEIGFIRDGDCRFRFVFGDDYQDFGKRYKPKMDAQWALMRKAFRTPNTCNVRSRFVKATIRGTVDRVPATGTIPKNEMPLQIVIQSVSNVERIDIKCTPSAIPTSGVSPSQAAEKRHSFSWIWDCVVQACWFWLCFLGC